MAMKERKFVLDCASTLGYVLDYLPRLPLDGTIEVVIRKFKRKRTNDQNALMWGFRIGEIADQAWVEMPDGSKRQFTEEIWHEYLKRLFLPRGDEENIEELVTNPDSYVKMTEAPDGEWILVGSTTQLTTKGFSEYVMKVEAYGASLGVLFSCDTRGM